MNPLRMLLLLAALVSATGCTDLGGGGSTGDDRPMGSGQTCTRRLSAVVDEDYLASQGLDVKKGQEEEATIQVGGAIAEVCTQGPSTLTVEEGAQRVADVVRKRYAD